MTFDLQATDSVTRARAGELTLPHGKVQTPIFMPVGTAGTVKTIRQEDLTDTIKAQIILGNTYHLYLRPGMDVIEGAGGLHKFMNWDKPLLTDSGGFQVFSLAASRKIKEEGVTFSSHIDGSKHLFSPENSMRIQQQIGADIIMAFDECPPYPSERKYAEKSLALTERWLKRCYDHLASTKPLYGYEQALFPIVQGSTYTDLRIKSAEHIAALNPEGIAIGGLSVGEPHHLMYEMTDAVTQVLPQQTPRYLMGVGTPENLLNCIALGVDMFDCVLPTRNARHGLLYTSEGIINIKNAKWKADHTPIDTESTSHLSRQHSKAYLRHLIHSGEALGKQISSMHNLSFFLWLMGEARAHILNGDFKPWMDQMIPRVTRRL